METTRRRLLTAMGALPIASLASCSKTEPSEPEGEPKGQPAPDRGPEPAPWQAPGTHDPAAFPWGITAGEASERSVLLGVRSTELLLSLTVVRADGEQWVEERTLTDLEPVDEYLQVTLEDLEPDTAYRYIFAAQADPERRSEVGRFRTALAAGSSRKITIAATSCLGGANPEFPSLGVAALDQADIVLLLGDTVYADGSVTLEDYRAVWDEQLRKENVRALLGSAGLVAVWDDHEVENNWSIGVSVPFGTTIDEAQLAAGEQAFLEAIPQRVPLGGPRYRSIVWGDVLEILALDSRGDRDRAAGKIVSDEQLAWVIDRLRASKATFKLLLASVHMADHAELMGEVAVEDRWQGYPEQREALLQVAAEVPGVLFVTGDMHYGAIQKLGPEGSVGSDLWEIAAGPAGSTPFAIEALADFVGGFPAQYVHVYEGHSFARIVLDPGLGEALVQLVDDAGATIAEQHITLR